MRLFALAIALTACTDGVAPPVLEQDLAVRVEPDQGVEDAGEDLLPAGDLLSVDLLPMACNTTCDCPAGDRCVAKVCAVSSPQVFCCGTAACTGSNVCETPRGQVSQCSSAPDAGFFPDAGAASCGDIPCIKGLGSAAFCTVACGRAATCQTTGGKDRCTP